MVDAPATILVVDDDQDCREMLSAMLAIEGYSVVTAANGAEALDVARSHHPAVILLDLMMPVMDGFQFRAVQRAEQGIAGIPIICISGTHNAKRAARQMGASGCFEKPIELDQLVGAIKEMP